MLWFKLISGPYEFENVDLDALDAVKNVVSIPQGTELLRITTHKLEKPTG